jgi:hypothetical protein
MSLPGTLRCYQENKLTNKVDDSKIINLDY